MTAYYNEFDPNAAAWLRELIRNELIAPGDVDERNITDVRTDDLKGYVQCHFFCGIAGWPYALRLAGWPDDRSVWTCSLPCQPFSAAGKHKGSADKRHLWPEMFRLIRECRPDTIFGEQVPAAIGHGWLDGICDDLEAEGYACGAIVLPACSVGAPHIRHRIWWVADAECARWAKAGGGLDINTRSESGTRRGVVDYRLAKSEHTGSPRAGGDTQPEGSFIEPCNADREEGATGSGLVNAESKRAEPEQQQGCGGCVEQAGCWSDYDLLPCRDGKARRVKSGVEPLVTRLSKGMGQGSDNGEPDVDATAEARVMRLRGYGNSIVAPLAAEFILAYRETINDTESR